MRLTLEQIRALVESVVTEDSPRPAPLKPVKITPLEKMMLKKGWVSKTKTSFGQKTTVYKLPGSKRLSLTFYQNIRSIQASMPGVTFGKYTPRLDNVKMNNPGEYKRVIRYVKELLVNASEPMRAKIAEVDDALDELDTVR